MIIFPVFSAMVLTLLAKGINCNFTGSTTGFCQILGQSIERALQTNINLMLSYYHTLGLPVWLVLIFVYHSFHGLWRILVNLICIWFVPHSPLVLGILAGIPLTHDGCFYPSQCVVLGVEIDSAIFGQGVLLWSLFFTLPICALASLASIAYYTRQYQK